MKCILCQVFKPRKTKPRPVEQTPQTPGFWDDMAYPSEVYDPSRTPHQQRAGAHAAAVEVPAAAEAKYLHTAFNLVYPHPTGTYVDIRDVQQEGVQIEQATGFLPDMRWYAPGPGAETEQWPVNYKATVHPLEGIIYRNAVIDEDEYMALAQARVNLKLQMQGG